MRLQKFAAAALSTAIACSVSVPAFAAGVNAGTNASVRSERSQVDGACMSSAVDKRDTAVIAAFDTFTASVKSALVKRKDDLKAAWALTDATARKTALRTAWQTFTKSHKGARDAYRKSKQAAWQQFRADAKTCRGNASEEGNVEATGEISL
jgi:hypothetical protein